MNILPFVFAVLLILSYGATASFQSRVASRRNQKAHLGLRKTELSMLRQSEKEQFNVLPGTLVKFKKEKGALPIITSSDEHKSDELKFNPPCARLNLFPLIEEGRNDHPNLYETAAKLLKTFYQASLFGNENRLEYILLDSLLTAAKRTLKEETVLPIETIDLNNPKLQAIYYTMLKGTRKCTLGQKGYPPLIDYIKIERKPAPICLFDAHPHMLAVFFGCKAALHLHEHLHDGQKQKIDLDEIIELTNDPHLALINPGVWKLLNFNRPTHGNTPRITLFAEDVETGISMRKDIQIKF